MRVFIIVGLVLLLTGGLIAAGIMPLKLSTLTGVVLRNTNLWIQGRPMSYGEPVELVFVFRVLDDGFYKFFGKLYRSYNVNRDSYAYKIKYGGSAGNLRVLVLRVLVKYEWDPDNVEEHDYRNWCGKFRVDTDGWAQNMIVEVNAAIYRAKLDENTKTLYLAVKERDVSYDEFAQSTLLVDSVIRDPRIVNSIMLNYGHSGDTYEIILYKKTVVQNGQIVWNQDAPRVYHVVPDGSWKGFHYELWPARIVWNNEVLWDSLGDEPSTTTVWNPVVTSYPGGGEAPSNNTSSVTTTRLTTTPSVTFTSTVTSIVNETTTTYTTTTIITSTETIPVNIEGEENNMLYGAVMSLAGLAVMVFGFRR